MNLAELMGQAYQNSQAQRAAHDYSAQWMKGSPPAKEHLVTIENYMSAPFNRWGFRNLEKLTRTTSIDRGTQPTSKLSYTLRDLSDFKFQSATGQSMSLEEHLSAALTDGFIVFKDNECVFEKYYDGHNERDRHIQFSTTKSLTGLIAEECITKGTLDASKPVTYYIPELTESVFGDATVRQVLDMTIGYDYYEKYDDPLSNTAQFGYASGLWMPPKGSNFSDNIYDYLKSQTKTAPHGVQFRYVTACTETVAWLIERASSRSITDIITEIWQKLGCERDAYFVNDATGRICCGGGLNSTLRDISRFALMVANRGQWDGQQIISRETVDRIYKGADRSHFALNEEFSMLLPGASYCSQWYVYEDESIMAAGIHGQIIYIHGPSSTVIVKQASHMEAGPILDLDTLEMLKSLVAFIDS